jgi:hypothetical protein
MSRRTGCVTPTPAQALLDHASVQTTVECEDGLSFDQMEHGSLAVTSL